MFQFQTTIESCNIMEDHGTLNPSPSSPAISAPSGSIQRWPQGGHPQQGYGRTCSVNRLPGDPGPMTQQKSSSSECFQWISTNIDPCRNKQLPQANDRIIPYDFVTFLGVSIDRVAAAFGGSLRLRNAMHWIPWYPMPSDCCRSKGIPIVNHHLK